MMHDIFESNEFLREAINRYLGFDNSLNDFARECGISRPTLYRATRGRDVSIGSYRAIVKKLKEQDGYADG